MGTSCVVNSTRGSCNSCKIRPGTPLPDTLFGQQLQNHLPGMWTRSHQPSLPPHQVPGTASPISYFTVQIKILLLAYKKGNQNDNNINQMFSADEPVGLSVLLAASSSLPWVDKSCKLHPGASMDIHLGELGAVGQGVGRISAPTLGCWHLLSTQLAGRELHGFCRGTHGLPLLNTKPIILVAIKREERQSPLAKSICKS